MANATKRKRDDEDSTDDADTDTALNNSALSDIAEAGFSIMTVRVGNKAPPKPSKAQLAAGWGPVCEDTTLPSIMPKTPKFGHRVRPFALWDAMKKYKQFVVKDNQFTVGDYIYINNHDFEEAESRTNDRQLWVAKVLETRARDGNFVRLRIAYLYWPDELPTGRLPFHGQREMIMSNHMDILDAQVVLDKAEVYQLTEEDQPQDGGPTEDNAIYWRQTYDVTDGKLSTDGLRIDCICQQPHNPEKLLVQCKNEACGMWNHEVCLEKEALKQEWAKMVNGEAVEPTDSVKVESANELGESIQVGSGNTDGAAEAVQAAGTPAREESVTSSSRKKPKLGRGRRGRSSTGKAVEADPEPWKGRLQAHIERIKSGPDYESPEITGRVKIKDLRKESQVVADEELKCLKCHTPFQ